MKLYRLLFLAFIQSVILFGQNTTGNQETPNFSPRSPEAGAFLKYGEYPVDLSTGLTEINIPIYTVKEGNYELPISLSYHPSGIKVEDEASWVGLGWNLNAGAQIILEVRDAPDEYMEADYNTIPDDFAISNIMSQNPIMGYYTNEMRSLRNLNNSRVRDVYNFSSPTANGKFVIDKMGPNYEVTIFPPDAFRVELIGPSNKRFRITDAMANMYIFDKTREESQTLQQYQPPLYTTAWYVDEIKTSTNEIIEFKYIDGGGITQTSYNQKIDHVNRIINNNNCVHIPGDIEVPELYRKETISSVLNSSTNLYTSTKKISEIKFRDGRILFKSSDGRMDFYYSNSMYPYEVNWPKKLDEIEIQSKTNENEFETLKIFKLSHSYFISESSNSNVSFENYRLKLDKVSEVLNIDNDVETEFTYSDIQLPPKNSMSTDYWGYYNGQSNLNRIPHQVIPFSPNGIVTSYTSVGDANRNVNPSVLEAGILKEIKYPTKGVTKFEYEPNDYFGINKFDKYTEHISTSNTLQGTGNGNVNPESITLPGINNIPNCNAPNPINCIQYREVQFTAINSQGILEFKVESDGTVPEAEMHYRYARVRVYDNNTGAIVYDSNKIHSNQVISFFFSATNPLNSGYILMEVYGAPLSIQDMSLHYYNENILTPLNNYGMGIRIKSISNYNFDSVLISKKIYEYSKSENPLISSGVLIKDVQSNYQSNPTVHALASCCDLQVCDPYTGCHQVEFGCDWKNFTTTSYMSNSITGVEGNSVIYSEVKVKEISNIDNSSNGFTKYFFTTDADFLFDSKGIVKVDFGYRRGKLLVKEIYRESNFPNNVPVLLNKIVNKYVDDDRRVSHIKGFILFQHIYVDSPPVNNTLPFDIGTILEPVTYDIPVNWFYQIESESTDYFYDMTDTFSKAITNKTRFIYNNPLHLQLSSQVTEGSTGEALETKYFYPQDSQMNGEAYVNDLIIKNMNGIPLDVQTFKNGSKISEQKTVYGYWNDTLLLPQRIQNSKENLDLKTRLLFNKYDEYGHVLEVQKENGLVVSYIWGYHKSQPVAKIENTSYDSISSELIASIQEASDNDNESLLLQRLTNLRNSLPDAMVTSYTYKPLLGVRTITDPKGYTTYYEYDSFGRLITVKDAQGNTVSENTYHYRTQN